MARLRRLTVSMLGEKISRTPSLVLLGFAVPTSVACNAIFGIEAGELVDGGALMTEGGVVDGGVVAGSGGRGAGALPPMSPTAVGQRSVRHRVVRHCAGRAVLLLAFGHGSAPALRYKLSGGGNPVAL